MFIEILGWLGGLCFAICAAPQAWQCFKQGHGQGISAKFMWIWLAGELLTIPYIYFSFGWQWPIMTNLVLNTFFILVIIYFMYFPRSNSA